MNMWNGFHRSNCHSACVSAGFSIIELLITLVLVAISLSLAVPSLQQFSANNQVLAASNSIVAGLNMARFNAITSGEETIICPSDDGVDCANDNWQNGWIVFVDEDGDGAADATELLRIVELEGNIQSLGFGNAITFESDGTITQGSEATITSCYSSFSISNKCVSVTINPFGSIVSADYEHSVVTAGGDETTYPSSPGDGTDPTTGPTS